MKVGKIVISLASVFLLLGCATSKFEDYEKPVQTAEPTSKVDENISPSATTTPSLDDTTMDSSDVKGYLNITTDQMNVRASASIQGEVVGTSSIGVFEVLDQVEADGYVWCKIGENEWVAQNDTYCVFTEEKPSLSQN